MYPTKKLSEICKLIMWQSPTSDTYNSEGNWLPFYQWKKEFGIIYPTPEVWCSKPIKIVEDWDVLISVRAPVWPTNLCWETSCIGRWLAGIRPNHDIILLWYLQLYFKKFESEISKLWKWSTFASINKSDLETLKIPLPPLPIQSRIVAKLDSAFGNIDNQIELLRGNIKDMENMRKSVLEMSFQQEWVQSKVMKDVFTACEYGSSKKSTEDESWVPVLRMWNIQNWWVRYDNLKYTPKESDDLPKLYLKKFDLLFNRTNSWELVGKTGIFLWEDDTISFAWYLIRLRFSSDILPQYANYYFNSEYFRKTQIEPQIDQQCGQANFSGWKLKETKFLYYPLPRQHEIVTHLDAVFDKTRILRSEYETQIQDLEVLKQSLLEEAFAGRLVTE